MNYIKHLTGFYERIHGDERLNPTHISLYLALFQFWNLNRFQNPISIARTEMMKLSKIGAFGTYHKCIRQLDEFGYIIYEPSFNPYKGSLVHLHNFDNCISGNKAKSGIKKKPASELVSNDLDSKRSTAAEQAVIPFVNNTNDLESKHIVNHTKINFQSNSVINVPTELRDNRFFDKSAGSDVVQIQDSEFIGAPEGFVMRSVAEVSGEISQSTVSFKSPAFNEVQLFFSEKHAPGEEAERFYNHYESNGWLVGGKAKMKNWQAAARNWLLNTKKFNVEPNSRSVGRKISPYNLSATTNKSYQEKL